MVTLKDLFNKFQDHCLVSDGKRTEYIEITAAVDFIKMCDTNDFAIIGLQGLELQDDAIYPPIDFLTDSSFLEKYKTSWELYRSKANAAACNTIEVWKNEVHGKKMFIDFSILAQQAFNPNHH